MRGLPPPPDDVALVTAHFDVDGSPATVGLWLFVPSLQALSVSQLELVVGDVAIWLAPLTTAVQHRGCRLTRVALRRYGTQPIAIDRQLLPAPGRWTGGQVLVACLTLHLLLGEGGRGRDTVIHLPGFPDVFSDDHKTLNPLGWGTASHEAAIFLAGVDTIPSPAGGTCVLGTVHRSAHNAPLAVSTFSPAQGIVPGRAIGTLDRRRLV